MIKGKLPEKKKKRLDNINKAIEFYLNSDVPGSTSWALTWIIKYTMVLNDTPKTI